MSTIDAPDRATPSLPGPPARILLIQAPYYDGVVGGMKRGAERVLAEAGAKLEVVDVAGAFELPAALRMAMGVAPGWDGYLLHGTPYDDSIGTAATHGCVRLRADDVQWLYENVPVGTPVYIY